MTERTTALRIDLSRRYGLPHGVRLIARDRDSIQIGTDPPRTVVLRHAPAESLGLLRQLDGRRAAGQVIITTATLSSGTACWPGCWPSICWSTPAQKPVPPPVQTSTAPTPARTAHRRR
ncbi:MAG TPA: hypothetical protein VIJ23_13765 [Mycobacterium sp.]